MTAPTLGLDKHAFDLGKIGFDALLECGHRSFDVGRRQRIGKVEADIEQNIVGSEVHRQELVDPQDAGLVLDGAAHAGDHRRPRGFADQQAFAFKSQPGGGQREDEADHHRRHTVEHREVQDIGQADTNKGGDQPQHRRGVFEQHRKDRRVFAVPHGRKIAQPSF